MSIQRLLQQLFFRNRRAFSRLSSKRLSKHPSFFLTLSLVLSLAFSLAFVNTIPLSAQDTPGSQTLAAGTDALQSAEKSIAQTTHASHEEIKKQINQAQSEITKHATQAAEKSKKIVADGQAAAEKALSDGAQRAEAAKQKLSTEADQAHAQAQELVKKAEAAAGNAKEELQAQAEVALQKAEKLKQNIESEASKIKAEAQQQAEQLKQQAAEQAEKLHQQAQAEADKIKKQLNDVIAQAGEQKEALQKEAEAALNQANQELKKQVDLARQEAQKFKKQAEQEAQAALKEAKAEALKELKNTGDDLVNSGKAAAASIGKDLLASPEQSEAVKKAKNTFGRTKSKKIAAMDKEAEEILSRFEKGIHFSGRLRITEDVFVEVLFELGDHGMRARGYLKGFKAGPLVVTGMGPDARYGTADDGAIIDIELTKQKKRLLISGLIELLGSMLQIDVLIENSHLLFYAKAKILNIFSITLAAASEGSGPEDFDFKVVAQIKNEFSKFMEEKGRDAILNATKKVADGIQKLIDELSKWKKEVGKLDAEQARMLAEIKKLQKEFRRKTAEAEKKIKPARDAVNSAQRKVKGIEKEIEKQRAIVRAEREEALRGLRKAQAKVQGLDRNIRELRVKLKQEREDAKRDVRSAQNKIRSLDKRIDYCNRKAAYHDSKLTWYNAVYHGPAIAYWKGQAGVLWVAKKAAIAILDAAIAVLDGVPIDIDPRLLALIAARESANLVLTGIIALIEVFPIDLDPRIVTLFVAMGAATAALEIAHVVLDGLVLAMNPDAIGEAIEIAKLYIKIALIEILQIAAVVALTVAQGLLEIAKLGIQLTGEMLALLAEAAAALMKIFSIERASMFFSLRNIMKGKLPDFELDMIFFGKRKRIILAIDLTEPGKFVKQLVKGLLLVLDPNYEAPQTSEHQKQIQAIKDRIHGKKGDLEAQREAKEQKKEELEAAEEERKARVDNLEASQEKARMKRAGKAMTRQIKASADGKNLNGNFMWDETWTFDKENQGAILFQAKTTNNFEVVFGSKEGEVLYRFGAQFAPNENHSYVIDYTQKKEGERKNLMRAVLPASERDTLKPYWIVFKNGMISFGKGTIPGKKAIAEWECNTPPRKITTFGFGGYGNTSFRYITGRAAHRIKAIEYGEIGTFTAHNTQNKTVSHQGWALEKPNNGLIIFETDNTQGTIGLHAGVNEKALVLTPLDKKASDNGGYMVHKAPTVDNGAKTVYWALCAQNMLIVGSGKKPLKKVLFMQKLDPSKQYTHWGLGSSSTTTFTKIDALGLPVGMPEDLRTLPYYEPDEFTLPDEDTPVWYPPWVIPAETNAFTFIAQTPKQVTAALGTAPGENTHLLPLYHAPEDNNGFITPPPDSETDQMFWVAHDHKNQRVRLGYGADINRRTIYEEPLPKDPAMRFFGLMGPGVTCEDISPVTREELNEQEAKRQEELKNMTPLQKSMIDQTIDDYEDYPNYTMTQPVNQFEWNRTWKFPLPEKGAFTCSPEVLKGLKIGLCSDPAAKTPPPYEFTIGTTESNPSRFISRGKKKDTIEADPIPANIKTIWVAFDNTDKKGLFAIGTGNKIGENTIFDFQDRGANNIHYFGFAYADKPTTIRAISAVKILDLVVNYPPIPEFTIAGNDYIWKKAWRFKTPNDGVILFESKSQKNLSVAFHSEARRGNKPFYRIKIGVRNEHGKPENTIILDGTGSKVVRREFRTGPLTVRRPGQFNQYWITFLNGKIEIGIGQVAGESTLLSWQGPKPQQEVKYFGFAGSPEAVTYRDIYMQREVIKDADGMAQAVCTGRTFQWHPVWRLPEQDKGVIFFESNAEKSVSAGFHSRVLEDSRPLYRLIIGSRNAAGDPQRTKVIDFTKTPKERVDYKTGPKTIQNPGQFNQYWIKFNRGEITIGTGKEVDHHVLVTHKDENYTSKIKYFGFAGTTLGGKQVPITYRNISIMPLIAQPQGQKAFIGVEHPEIPKSHTEYTPSTAAPAAVPAAA